MFNFNHILKLISHNFSFNLHYIHDWSFFQQKMTGCKFQSMSNCHHLTIQRIDQSLASQAVKSQSLLPLFFSFFGSLITYELRSQNPIHQKKKKERVLNPKKKKVLQGSNSQYVHWFDSSQSMAMHDACLVVLYVKCKACSLYRLKKSDGDRGHCCGPKNVIYLLRT